ncbi:hypothetical protein F5Y03DRAFT_336030 [Xylaria venustula]|nr:hypothetical protein F5Y03DRAFT_336030 [Xylaria venustula]
MVWHMELFADPMTPAHYGDVASMTSKEHLDKKHSHRFLHYIRWLSQNGPILKTSAFLTGSIVFSVLSHIVQTKQSPLIQQFSSSLSPSCTDFGDSVEEQRFALDLAYGNFTFTQAKIIDVTWDTVVGQGGRFLHAWILYRCIIYPLLVLAMEISTVTYPYYTTLSFSSASFETLAQVLKTRHLTSSWSILLCTISLTYSLIYTLFFSLIWGAATGYLSLSHKLYAMPGGDIIPLTSEDLSLCWVLDPTRHELHNDVTTPHIEVGPNFSEILSTSLPSSQNPIDLCLNITEPRHNNSQQYQLQYGFGGWTLKSAGSTIWDVIAIMGETGFENFFNIQKYALTRQFLQIGLDAPDWLQLGWRAEDLVENVEPVKLDWFSTNKSSCRNISTSNLYSTLYAVTLEVTEQRLSAQHASTVDIRPYNTSAVPAYWSLFSLNQSIQLRPGIVPYNSTLWFNDTLIPLDAPFLDIGFNCSGSYTNDFNRLGNCVCYKGQPIPLELMDNPICNTAPGYVWGFSSFLTRLGLILEAVWMACCFITYPWLLRRSKLLKSESVKSAKAMRLLLDCAEAAYSDLGPDAKDICEDEIARRLENIEVGYHTEEHEGQLRHRLVSGPKPETHILNRITDSPVHDRMNEWLKRVVAAWTSFLAAGRPRPTTSEVYEDINWRFQYDRN